MNIIFRVKLNFPTHAGKACYKKILPFSMCYLDCDMSTQVPPSYKCRNNNLTAYWPTGKLYSVATKQLSEDMETALRETGW